MPDVNDILAYILLTLAWPLHIHENKTYILYENKGLSRVLWTDKIAL